VKERYVMSEIRSFDERFRIAYCEGGDRKGERENETAEVRILFGESVDATTRQFFFSFLSTESDEGNEGAFE